MTCPTFCYSINPFLCFEQQVSKRYAVLREILQTIKITRLVLWDALFLQKFCGAFSKAIVSPLLACLFDSNESSNGHTQPGVVTCSDESHHLSAAGAQGREGTFFDIFQKVLQCKTFLSYKLCKILFAEHIVLEFTECIILHFDVFANGLLEKFKECLHLVIGYEIDSFG